MGGQRSTATSRTNRLRRGPRLGLLADAFDDPFQSDVLIAAEREARGQGLDFLAVAGGMLGADGETPKNFIFDLVGQHNVDALLICTHTIGQRASPELIKAFVDRFAPLPRVCLGVQLPGVLSLLMDNETGMYTAVRHLLTEHAHRRLAIIAGPDANPEAQARYQGYMRALGESGLNVEPRYVVQGDFTRASGARAVAVLFDERGLGPGELDGIVSANDPMALGAFEELDRRGVRVPRDLAVVGVDDLEIARYARVPLTTVRQPVVEQVSHAVRVLAEALRGAALREQAITFQTEFVRRRSCGCSVRAREPLPAWSTPGREDFATALRARRAQVTSDLRRAAHGGFDFVPEGWEGTLFDSFLDELADPQGGRFAACMDDICDALLRRRASAGSAQDVLIALRRDAMRFTVDPQVRGRIDTLLEDALLQAGDAATISASQRRVELADLMVTMSDATAAMLAAPSVHALADAAAEHLPHLGIGTALIALPPEHAQGQEWETALLFTESGRLHAPLHYPAGQLAPPKFLDGRSVIAMPLGFRGEQLGVALLECGAMESMLYEELRLVLSAALKGALLTRAVEQARLKVELLASTDPLTGLYNRRHLTGRLRQEFARARRNGRSLSVVLVDLDGFKQVNDLQGHEAGDRVLTTVANRLRGGVREVDMVARFGGDEFVLVLPETAAAQARTVAQRILRSLRHPPSADDIKVSATFGVATHGTINPASHEDELLRRADRALLAAKRTGKARVLHEDDLPLTEPG